MNKELSSTLYYYFNKDLKQSLNYKDLFGIPKYIPQDYIITFDKTNNFNDLKNILVSDHELVIQLKAQLKALLENYFEGIVEINLIFDDLKNSFGIKLIRGKLEYLDLDAYVNILSTFD